MAEQKVVTKKHLRSSAMQVVADEVIGSIQQYSKTTDIAVTPYGMQCIDSALSKINDLIEKDGLNWNFFNTPSGINNLFSTLKYVSFMELNVANNEVAITFRNVKSKNGTQTKVLETQIQGVGNDRILKKFGEGVVEVKSYLVYEGDEFTFPYIDGFDVILPKYSPKFKSEKVQYAVYLIKLKSGDIDVSIASREDVKVSLLAHINQNMRFNDAFTTKLQTELENLSLDEILYNEKYAKMTIGRTRLISPAWGDFAKERMIARKIRNHALRKWSHNLNFGKKELLDIYEEGFEEENYKVISTPPTNYIENNEREFENESSSVEVDEINENDSVEEQAKNVGETFEVVDETTEINESENIEVEEFEEIVEEPQDDDIPDWAKI